MLKCLEEISQTVWPYIVEVFENRNQFVGNAALINYKV